MTAVTALPDVRRPSPTVHTARWLLRQHLGLAVWAVSILVLLATIALILVDRYGAVEVSVVQFGRQGFIWFPFSVAIIIVTAYVNVHVAAGLTRRSLGLATVAVGLTMAAFYTIVMTGALQLERAVYGSRRWAQQITDDAPVFSDTSQVGWILTDLGLVFTASQLCALLVGVVYYRYGGWWGTLALPLTVGPVLLISPLLTTPLLDPLSRIARVPIAVGVLAVIAIVYLALLRRVPIHSVT